MSHHQVYYSLQSDFEGKSDAYKFLFSRIPSKKVIPGFNMEKVNELITAVTLVPNEGALRRSYDVSIAEKKVKKVNANESLFYEKEFDLQLESQIDSQLSQDDSIHYLKLEESCSLTEKNSKLSKSQANANEYPELSKKESIIKQFDEFEAIGEPRKKRISDLSKTSAETACCENLRKDKISQREGEDVEEDNKDDEKADWNYFSLRRACFRGMSAYYKSKFASFCKSFSKQKPSKSGLPMDKLVGDFISSEYKNSK